MTAEPAISKDRLIAQPDGSVTVPYKQNGVDGVLSIQPDGSFGWRVAGTAGPWEAGRVEDNKIVWRDSAYPLGAYAVLLV